MRTQNNRKRDREDLKNRIMAEINYQSSLASGFSEKDLARVEREGFILGLKWVLTQLEENITTEDPNQGSLF